ncbi:ATP-binding cassette domain-containing protein [Candidatus Aerophobetes bacterium]|nr:ATP-binding cassette domain-containing protein [Candidatus Aerophobetes bacterium]
MDNSADSNKKQAIRVSNLTKEFNGFKAIDNISFSVEEGEIFGMLGPNGAGKTTTIRILSTTLKATKGEAFVWGYDISKQPDKIRRSIGIVFQDQTLDDRLTGMENLDFHARLYGMKRNLREKRIKEVLHLVDLWDKRNTLVKYYSGGMCRRLEIARGLMHYPRVLFLDEPTLGLDAQTRHNIWEHIRVLNKREKIAILLTTHYMDEADTLCNRVGIIDKGKILIIDEPEKLKNMVGKDLISIKVSSPEKMMQILSNFEWVSNKRVYDGLLHLEVTEGEKRIPFLINLAQRYSLSVDLVSLRRPTLEDVFLHFTGKRIREEEGTLRERISARIRSRRRR